MFHLLAHVSYVQHFFLSNTSTPQYAGIKDEGLAFGPTISQTKYNLVNEKRVQNYMFYSCQRFGSLRVIITSKDYDICFEVEINLLRHKKATKTLVIDGHGSNLSAESEKND